MRPEERTSAWWAPCSPEMNDAHLLFIIFRMRLSTKNQKKKSRQYPYYN